jgi:4-hydroxyproline epimerase
MSEKRQDFLARIDWIRTGLMFEPRGHDMMSGGRSSIPLPATDTDAGILFIETSGCLPMCGHGTIGIITFGLENGLITPRVPGRCAGGAGRRHRHRVRTAGRPGHGGEDRNVPGYLATEGIEIDVPGFGPLKFDVAYGGNFYAIIEPQGAYQGLEALGAREILRLSPIVRELVREKTSRSIRGPDHPRRQPCAVGRRAEGADADGRNAVFYGDKAIDRSPCGTGTSARLAHLHAKGRLKVGDDLRA